MTTFDRELTRHRRQFIQRLLSLFGQGGLIDEMILYLVNHFGHNASLDQVRTDLTWLADQGLVSTSEIVTKTVIEKTIISAKAM
ncbi:MAG TPA: hypothetical protein VGA44_05930 [Steroidobacteraceae bacterium]